jgi:hypothetical protein
MREKKRVVAGVDAPLPEFATNPGGRIWTEKQLSVIERTYADADRIAFVNIMPYRSAEGSKDLRMLNKLASARMVRDWARDTLFPAARDRKRVVVCIRPRGQWGPPLYTHDGTLFAPECSRGGHMCYYDERTSALRSAVIEAVHRALRQRCS